MTLGREPNDEETLDFLRFYFSQLIFTSELVRKRHSKIKNPNLLQWAVRKQMDQKLSSMSQEPLQFQNEERKTLKTSVWSTKANTKTIEIWMYIAQKLREKHKEH